MSKSYEGFFFGHGNHTFVPYKVYPDMVGNDVIIVAIPVDRLKELPEGERCISADFIHYYTANKLSGYCRGLFELGYFSINDNSIVYVDYASTNDYISRLEVRYKKGKIRKRRIPDTQYSMYRMTGFTYLDSKPSWHKLKDYSDIIKYNSHDGSGMRSVTC